MDSLLPLKSLFLYFFNVRIPYCHLKDFFPTCFYASFRIAMRKGFYQMRTTHQKRSSWLGNQFWSRIVSSPLVCIFLYDDMIIYSWTSTCWISNVFHLYIIPSFFIANISRLMKNVIPRSGKVAKDAKECVQECVSEFISFITSEACDRCLNASVFYVKN